MIILRCLLAFLGLGISLAAIPSRFEIETSINRTIDEVERMVRENPNLPRLSRTQIIDILYNITSKDVETYKDADSIEKVRKEYQRALMVVLPYDPEKSKENLKDLYTKPPMVQIISDESTTERMQSSYGGKRKEVAYLGTSGKPAISDNEEAIDNSVSPETTDEPDHLVNKNQEPEKVFYANHKETYADVGSNVSPEKLFDNDQRYKTFPERFNFDLESLQKSRTTERSTTITRNPIFRQSSENPGESTAGSSKLEIVYSTSVTSKPTIKSTTEILQGFDDGAGTTTSSPKVTEHVLTSDRWHYFAPPGTTELPKRLSLNYKNDQKPAPFSPAALNAPEVNDAVTTTWRPDVTIKILGTSSKDKSKEQRVQIIKTERPAPVYVTPMSSTSSSSRPKYSSTYTLASGGFLTGGASTPVPMREDVKNLLASIGLFPANNNLNLNGAFDTEGKQKIPNTNNIVYSQTSGLAGAGVGSPSILSQNTFEDPHLDIRKGVENLTPDVQLLFQRFGLQTSGKQPEASITTTTTSKPTPVVVNLNSYNKFKPLPTAPVKDQDMRDFLAKFGLGNNDNRNDKAMKPKKSPKERQPSLLDALPGSMKKVLENIGLITRSQKSVEITATKTKVEKTESNEKIPNSTVEPPTTTELHVFKPHEATVHTEEQKDKINKLLETVKMVQEGKADPRDVQKVADDLIQSSKSLQAGPDPLNLEEILRMYNDDIRNEVKRQQQAEEVTTEDDGATLTATAAADASSTMSSADDLSTSTTMMLTTTAAPAESANLAALAESFGGTTQAPDPMLPTPRRNGLYFLLDWNTFLEVGEEGKDRVNLRFQPKVGDRSRFIPVTVP